MQPLPQGSAAELTNLLDVVDLILSLLEVDDLDGDGVARHDVRAAVHRAERAAPYLLEVAEALLRPETRHDIHGRARLSR